MKTLSRLALIVCAISLALASFSPIILQPSGAQTGSSAGTWQAVPNATSLAVMVDVTAASGTIVFDAWLQGTNDSADANGYDVPADVVFIDTGGGAGAGTVTTNAKDIVDNKTTTAAARFTARYGVFPYKYCRLRWTLTGSTPSVTFSATAGTK